MENKKFLEPPYLIIDEDPESNKESSKIDDLPIKDYLPIINKKETNNLNENKVIINNKIRLRRSLDNTKTIENYKKDIINDCNMNINRMIPSIIPGFNKKINDLKTEILFCNNNNDDDDKPSNIKDEDFNFIYEKTSELPFPDFVKKKYYIVNTENKLVQLSKFANLYLSYAFRNQTSISCMFVNDDTLKSYYKTDLDKDDDSIIKYFSKPEFVYSLDYLAIFTHIPNMIDGEIMLRYKTLLKRKIPILTSPSNINLTKYRFKNFRDIIPVCHIPIDYDSQMDINKNYLNSPDILFGDICLHGKDSLCHETFCVEHHNNEWKYNDISGELFYFHPHNVPLRKPKTISTSDLLNLF